MIYIYVVSFSLISDESVSCFSENDQKDFFFASPADKPVTAVRVVFISLIYKRFASDSPER